MPAALVAFLIGVVMPSAGPPPILLIYREPVNAGGEAAYEAIEKETARLAVELGCPHPYLAAESLSGPKEIWWFNGFESPADEEQVADDYKKNTRWTAALERNSARKKMLTREPFGVSARYRPDLTTGVPWILGRGRFLVIAMTKSDRAARGTIFEGPDGTRFIVTPAQTGKEADAAKAAAGANATVLAVRPDLSFPSKAWIAADPTFWQPRSSRKGE